MSPAAKHLHEAGFERIGALQGIKGFETWHLRTAGCDDIAVAIPTAETAAVSWAVRGIYQAGIQQGQACIRAYWMALDQVMKAPAAAVGVAVMPEVEETKEP